jgi:hypothetical protein
MAVTFVNEAHNIEEAAVTSFVVNVPAGVVDGDLLIGIAVSETNPVTWTPPAAFADRQVNNVTSGAAGSYTIDVSVRVASSEPASYTWTTAVSDEAVLAILAYRGNKLSSYFNTTSHSTSDATTPITFPSVTPTANGCMLIDYVGSDNLGADGAGTYSTPAGYTNRVNIQNVSQRVSLAVFDKIKTPAGLESGVTTAYTVSEPTVPIGFGVMAIESLLAVSSLISADNPPMGIAGRGAGW